MNTTIQIRKAIAHDYKYLRQLPVHFGGARAKLHQRKFRFMMQDRHSLLFVCEANERLRGFAALKRQPGGDGIVLLDYFNVDATALDNGIAEQLEQEVIGLAIGLETTSVVVQAHCLSADALTFFNSRGYDQIGDTLSKKLNHD